MNPTSLGAAHFASAIAALALGAAVVPTTRKGTSEHRLVGMGFVLAMVTVNVTALGLYRLTGTFGPFHALALMSLMSLLLGVVPALRRQPGWLVAHYKG